MCRHLNNIYIPKPNPQASQPQCMFGQIQCPAGATRPNATHLGGIVLGVVGPVDGDGAADVDLGEEGRLLRGDGAPGIRRAGGRHFAAVGVVIVSAAACIIVDVCARLGLGR